MRIRSLVYSILCGSVFAAFASLYTQPRLTRYPGVRNNGPRTDDDGLVPEAPRSPAPDERFKADILVVVAHPDDETMVSAYLAKAVYDEHKRVAVIYGTRGDGGGNAMGYEQAAALGAEREIEARRACAFLDIMNVWFLDGPIHRARTSCARSRRGITAPRWARRSAWCA